MCVWCVCVGGVRRNMGQLLSSLINVTWKQPRRWGPGDTIYTCILFFGCGGLWASYFIGLNLILEVRILPTRWCRYDG